MYVFPRNVVKHPAADRLRFLIRHLNLARSAIDKNLYGLRDRDFGDPFAARAQAPEDQLKAAVGLSVRGLRARNLVSKLEELVDSGDLKRGADAWAYSHQQDFALLLLAMYISHGQGADACGIYVRDIVEIENEGGGNVFANDSLKFEKRRKYEGPFQSKDSLILSGSRGPLDC
jgi:hypothetical protein